MPIPDPNLSDEQENEQLTAFVVDLFRKESAHWQAEYEALTQKHGSYGATKVRAAFRLGSSMLARRADQYEAGLVGHVSIVEPDE